MVKVYALQQAPSIMYYVFMDIVYMYSTYNTYFVGIILRGSIHRETGVRGGLKVHGDGTIGYK